MSKRVKNALIIILLLVVALGGGCAHAVRCLRIPDLDDREADLRLSHMAQQKFGDEGEAIVLIDHNEDAIALLCCNATRDKGYFELHKRDLISGKWEKSMAPGTLERKLVCTVMQRPTSVRTIPKEPPIFR